MQTYLFYDIETTGLNKSFDQVLQFAAIRTDLNLNELERHEIKVKLNPDVIPSPRALITHHISIKQPGINEFDAIKKIHALMNIPGTLSLGYNTLGFDDEFLRFSFYRNLLAPYTHQWANQCGRLDIYPMTIMYYLFKNEVIQWPRRDGKISLKLEDIKTQNQLFDGASHDAMVDVEVTLALARRLFAEREMWDYLLDYFNKQTDEKRSRQLSDQTALMVYGKLGADNGFQTPVFYLGNHRHYKNQSLWLRLDTEIMNTTPENIAETTWALRKKSAEPGFILPLDKKYLTHLSADRLNQCEENKKWLQQNPDLLKQIINYHAEYKYPVVPNTDVAASLYSGFLSFDEEKFCRQFHAAAAAERARLTASVRSAKIKTLALRILGRHFKETMLPDQTEDFSEYLQNNDVIDFRGEKKLTREAALAEITLLREEAGLSDTQLKLLKELEQHLK